MAPSTPGPHGTRRRSPWVAFFVSWIALSLLTGMWSLATPLGGAPDEPAHIIKAAAVVRGQFLGTTTEGGQQVSVPAYISYTGQQSCFAFNPKITADCIGPIQGDPNRTVTSVTSAGLYNPTYYLLVGWPSLLFHTDAGVYAMRIVSGILSSLFLAAAFMIISSWRRRTLPLIGFAVALTPMVFFLDAVVNPNSIEITATLAAFVGVLGIVLHPSRSLLVQRSVIVLVSAAIAVNMRGVSPLWVAIAVLIPFVLSTGAQIRDLIGRWPVRIAVIGVAVSTAAALAWTGFSNSLGAGLSSPTHHVTGLGVGASPLRGFAQIFAGTFDYGQGYVGIFGWLDTPVPPAVFFVWSVFVGGLVIAGFMFLRGRTSAFALALIGGLLLLPPTLQAIYVTGGGIIWQGRYALPLFVCVMVGVAAVLADRIPALGMPAARRLVVAITVLWLGSQVFAFVDALKRYGVGVGGNGASWRRFFFDPSWNPPGGTLVITLAYAVICAAAALLFLRSAQPGAPVRLRRARRP
jgi:hypothetical protein